MRLFNDIRIGFIWRACDYLDGTNPYFFVLEYALNCVKPAQAMYLERSFLHKPTQPAQAMYLERSFLHKPTLHYSGVAVFLSKGYSLGRLSNFLKCP